MDWFEAVENRLAKREGASSYTALPPVDREAHNQYAKTSAHNQQFRDQLR
jgi:hypothetical protein